jgi:hypothetical protein
MFWVGELEIYETGDGSDAEVIAWGRLAVTPASVEALLAQLSSTSLNASIGDEVTLAPYRDTDVPVVSTDDATRAGRELAREICRQRGRVQHPIAELDAYIAAAEEEHRAEGLYREILPIALVVAGRAEEALALAARIDRAEQDPGYRGFAQRLAEYIRAP